MTFSGKMKIRLKNILTVRIYSHKLLNNLVDEAKIEIPSLFHPVAHHHDHPIYPSLLGVGIVILGLSFLSRHLEIKSESKLEPFINANQIQMQIKCLFVLLVVSKYLYYNSITLV